MNEIIEFDDFSVLLSVIAVVARTKEDGPNYSYFIQTAFGKLTKHTGPTYDEVEKHRTDLIEKMKALG